MMTFQQQLADWLSRVRNTPLLRLAVALLSGVLGYFLVYHVAKKWKLTETRHREMGFGGGVAIAIIVWLLLEPDRPAAVVQPGDTVTIVPPSPAGISPVTLSYIAPNITLQLNHQPPSVTSCGCGCGEVNNTLADIFNSFAQAFFKNAQADEAAVVAAQLASIPDYASQYFNDQLPYEEALSDTALFFSAQGNSNTFLPGGISGPRIIR